MKNFQFNKVARFSVLAVALSVSGRVNAEIVFDESVNGDAIQDHPFTTIQLHEGLNIVKGSFSQNSGANDLDYFLFAIPAGKRLVTLDWSATGLVEFTNPEPPSGFFQLTYRLFEGSKDSVGQLLEAVTLDVNNPQRSFAFTSDGFSDWILLGPDKFSSNGGGVGTYEIRFEVQNIAPIPLPSSGILLVPALIALGSRKRMKRYSAISK
jgi:hypothetical protein